MAAAVVAEAEAGVAAGTGTGTGMVGMVGMGTAMADASSSPRPAAVRTSRARRTTRRFSGPMDASTRTSATRGWLARAWSVVSRVVMAWAGSATRRARVRP